ncbi:hypothetical protein EV363DRAFT_1164704, partial [Boletus edulis]
SVSTAMLATSLEPPATSSNALFHRTTSGLLSLDRLVRCCKCSLPGEACKLLGLPYLTSHWPGR